jgi:hypothetical protein
MRHRASTIPLLAAALTAALAPAARAACSPALGSTYNVSDPSDSEPGQPAAPGTLRYVVANASPGSVIGFCENYLIRLNSPIEIPREKAGLQLVGPSTIAEAPPHAVNGQQTDPNGELAVKAPNVAVRALRLSNVNVSATATADGLRVLGNQIAVLNPSRDGKGAAIDLEGRADEQLRGVRIGSKGEPNAILSSQKAGIAAFETNGLEIVGNTIDASGGDFAIDDEGGAKLLVRDNTIEGTVNAGSDSGRIAGNTVTAKGRVLGIRLHSRLDRYGAVTIERNTVTGGGNIRLERDRAEVLRNEVTGARQPGIHARCNSESGDAVGPTRIVGNLLQRSDFGVLYQCGADAKRGTVKDNAAKGNRRAGVGIQGTRVDVAGNTATGNGAAGIAVNAPRGGVRLVGNEVSGNRSTGIEFKKRTRATVTGGSVHDNRGPGARVEGRALVAISRVEFARNAGAGIDLLPAGATPNRARKPENRNIDWPEAIYDPASGKIEGRTCSRCAVEAFTVEAGARAGNPRNGEGAEFLAAVTAKGGGSFTYPARGRIGCAAARKITFTATQRRTATSEFSEDVKCAAEEPKPPEEKPPGCGGNAATTVTIRDENLDGDPETSWPTEIPAGCDIGLRSDGRTGRYWSMRVYDAADASKLYFCTDGAGPPPGETACTSLQPTSPPDSDVIGNIAKDAGAWRLYVHLNSRDQGLRLTVRVHYSWKET